jgi:hypothetical protein
VGHANVVRRYRIAISGEPKVSRRLYNCLLLSTFLYLLALGNLPGQQSSTTTPAVGSAVALVLDRHGCVPGEIVFPVGNNLLEVVNRTGLASITYHIRSSESGAANPSLLDYTLPGRTSRAYH